MELGDSVEKALSSVGVTKERVSKWLGRPCNCSARQEKLNQLSRWARRVLSGRTDRAEEYLNRITETQDASPNVSADQADPPLGDHRRAKES